MVNFIRTATAENPENISFGYNIKTGAPLYPTKKSTRFSAPLITGAIVSKEHQKYLNDGWDLMAKTRESYYSDYLNLLSMLVISGNWWPPVKDFTVDLADGNTVAMNAVRFADLTHVSTGTALNLSFSLSGIDRDLPVALLSLTGRELATGVAKVGTDNQFSATLTASLSPAIYLVKIGDRMLSHTAKIVVQ